MTHTTHTKSKEALVMADAPFDALKIGPEDIMNVFDDAEAEADAFEFEE